MLSHSVGQRRGNDRLHSYRLLRHRSFFNTSCADIVKKQYAYFVSAYQLVGAVRTFHGNTYTVRIRIRCQHQIRADLFRQLQALLQSLKDFRVRIAAGSKISVGIFLIRYDRNICDSDIL